jgi:hypothetical protein
MFAVVGITAAILSLGLKVSFLLAAFHFLLAVQMMKCNLFQITKICFSSKHGGACGTDFPECTVRIRLRWGNRLGNL